MKNILVILMIAFSSSVFAQQSVSVRGAGGINQDAATNFYHDQHGNFYMYMFISNPGWIYLFGDSMINPYTNNSVYVLSKFNSQMNLLWSHCYQYFNYSNNPTQNKIAVD